MIPPPPEEPEEIVSDEERDLFDRILEKVLGELPEHLHGLLEEVPLVVEDYPSDQVMEEMGIEDPGDLCGLHTGIPLTERSVFQSGELEDMIHIYREGILRLATDQRGYVSRHRLRRQIRITLLHEIGHHFGLDEQDLERLGYG